MLIEKIWRFIKKNSKKIIQRHLFFERDLKSKNLQEYGHYVNSSPDNWPPDNLSPTTGPQDNSSPGFLLDPT